MILFYYWLISLFLNSHCQFSVHSYNMTFMIKIWGFWLHISVSTRPSEDGSISDYMQKEETLTKHLRLLSEADRAIFETWKQFVELFVQKQSFWDHRPEAICMVVLACFWATEVSEILGLLTCFWFLERFL